MLKKAFFYGVCVLGVMMVVVSCSTKKDRFLNRNTHALKTRYNILYNGYVAFDQGLGALQTGASDNFWQLLPVEPLHIDEKSDLPDQKKSPKFERAEKKAVKAIAKHSMLIEGDERNYQVDEAYLLLAKARYFDGRFVPAIEALNYILYKYPKSNKVNQALIWREKTNIRLGSDDLAIKNLKQLVESEDSELSSQDLADSNATLAQAFLNQKQTDSAIPLLKIASLKTKNKKERARYYYILGQLYEQLEQHDSAALAYQKVIEMKRKAPRVFTVNAHVRQLSLIDAKAQDTLELMEKWTKLLEDRENRPYIDLLYHALANYHNNRDKESLAETFYNKSLRIGSTDRELTARNYLALAEMYFDRIDYRTAGKYYDSTMLQMDQKSKDLRKIKKKREDLVDVIKYEDIVKVDDSLLMLVNMNEDQRKTYFTSYVERLKAEDIQAAKKALEELEKQNNSQNTGSSSAGSSASASNTTSGKMFYFYNPVTAAYGKKEFEKRWGKRELVDNWRWSKKAISSSSEENGESEDSQASLINEEDPKYQIENYIVLIPSDQKVIDSIQKEDNFAYYQLGLLYKEKFKEYDLSASKLEKLLSQNPEERLKLPALYHLYKVYQIIDSVKAGPIKDKIISDYPESRYAQILINPEQELTNGRGPDDVYKAVFERFRSHEIREAYKEVNEAVEQFMGTEYVAKFELLRSQIKARLFGVQAYKEDLNFVALNYPNLPEGKKANQMLKEDVVFLETKQLDTLSAKNSKHWKIIFPKVFPLEKESTDKLIASLEAYLKKVNNTTLKITDDIYSLNTNFVVLHGFTSEDNVKSFIEHVFVLKELGIKDEHYIISSQNYSALQIGKFFDKWKMNYRPLNN